MSKVDGDEVLIAVNQLTQDRVKSLASYDPETGEFTWLPRTCKTSFLTRAWNGKFAGKIVRQVNQYGYRRISFDGKHYLAHRVVFLYMTGKMPPKDVMVDHINGVITDNRFCNLRLIPAKESAKNMAVSYRNKFGIRGVSWSEKRERWLASIRSDNKTYYLGSHKTLLDAASARKSAELQFGFHPNHGRPAMHKWKQPVRKVAKNAA